MFKNKQPFKNKKRALHELRYLYNTLTTDVILYYGIPITMTFSRKSITIESDGAENNNTVDFFKTLCFMGYMEKTNNSNYKFTQKGVDYCASYEGPFLDWMNNNPWVPGLIAGGISLVITVTKLISSP